MSQADDIRTLLSDRKPHSSFEIVSKVYKVNHACIARVASRIYDLRSKGINIRSAKSKKNPKKHWYIMAVCENNHCHACGSCELMIDLYDDKRGENE